ncbi:hypothetical protein ABZP36_002934 [Zizania latifolia]
MASFADEMGCEDGLRRLQIASGDQKGKEPPVDVPPDFPDATSDRDDAYDESDEDYVPWARQSKPKPLVPVHFVPASSGAAAFHDPSSSSSLDDDRFQTASGDQKGKEPLVDVPPDSPDATSDSDDAYYESDEDYVPWARQSKDKPLKPVHFVPASSGAAAFHDPSSLSSSLDDYRFRDTERWRSLYPSPPQGLGISLASDPKVAKMMARMNYEGVGLGKYGHGIIDLIEPIIWPKPAGLGAVYGSHGLPAPFGYCPENSRTGNTGANRDFCAGVKTMVRAALRREGEAYAAARAQKIRHVSVHTARLLKRYYGDKSMAASAKKEIILAVGMVQKESTLGRLTLGGLICEFAGLKKRFPKEYRTDKVAHTAAQFAVSLLRPELLPRYGTREPINAPEHALALVHSLRNILDGDDASAPTPYAMLINDVVVGTVKESSWNVTEPELMIQFVETWKETLPPSDMRFILDEVVMPKLVYEAESWSPGWWTVPSSAWLGSWIRYFGYDRLRGMLDAIGTELGKSMRTHGVTYSSYSVVSPWKEVFDQASWDEFVQRHVVPEVRKSLRDLKISPVMTWRVRNTFPLVMKYGAPIVPARYMVPLLEAEFFGKWRHAVYRLLIGLRPLPEQAAAWYEGWKGLFTPELLADERVIVQLEAGLDMINRAAQGLEIVWPDKTIN